MKKINLKIFVLVYDISCKSLIGAKPLRVRFDFGNGFISVYDTSRYLVLFSTDKYDAIYNNIRYLLSLKNGTTYVISHSYARNAVDSFDSFTLEKPIAFQNVITLISQLLIRINITTTIIYFEKKIEINHLKIINIYKL